MSTELEMETPTHEPVLLPEVVSLLREGLAGKERPRILDGTLGLGGYSEAFLREFPNARVLGLDRDAEALKLAQERLSGCASGPEPRFRAARGNFGNLEAVAEGEKPFDALAFDLGVSNLQLTEAARGFSFMRDGPLDMRMDPGGDCPTAAELLARLDEGELARIFRDYGGERYALRIASRIVAHRKRGGRLETTGELVSLIRELLPAPVQRKMGGHPARRVFQALRIAVNNELGELESLLASLPRVAARGAAVAVVTYHSLEDRLVKHRFRAWEREEGRGKVLTRHPILPSEEETARNYKSRSAKLRGFRFLA